MVPQTANVILFHKHSLVDLQTSPRTGSSNLTQVMNVRFSHARSFSKCLCYTQVRSLFSCQARLYACSCLQPRIAIDIILGTYSVLYYHQMLIYLNSLKDQCNTCPVMAALLLSCIGPLLCTYSTDDIVTTMPHNELTNKYETITIPFQLYSLAPDNSNILSQENN